MLEALSCLSFDDRIGNIPIILSITGVTDV